MNPSRNACMSSAPSRVGSLLVKMSNEEYNIDSPDYSPASPDYSPEFDDMPRIFVPGATEPASSSPQAKRKTAHPDVAVPSSPQSLASSKGQSGSSTQREGGSNLFDRGVSQEESSGVLFWE